MSERKGSKGKKALEKKKRVRKEAAFDLDEDDEDLFPEVENIEGDHHVNLEISLVPEIQDESIVEMLASLEAVKKKKKSGIRNFATLVHDVLHHHRSAEENQDGRKKLEKVSKRAKRSLKKKVSRANLSLKDAVRMAREQLGASEVLKEIRSRKHAYTQEVEEILAKPKRKTFQEDHPYVALWKRLEEVTRSGKHEYKVQCKFLYT
jgi:hypothetical protein